MKRDEPFEGQCTYESDIDHILVGRMTFVSHTDHLKWMLIFLSSPESVMHKVKFICLDGILSKKMQDREECVIAG